MSGQCVPGLLVFVHLAASAAHRRRLCSALEIVSAIGEEVYLVRGYVEVRQALLVQMLRESLEARGGVFAAVRPCEPLEESSIFEALALARHSVVGLYTVVC